MRKKNSSPWGLFVKEATDAIGYYRGVVLFCAMIMVLVGIGHGHGFWFRICMAFMTPILIACAVIAVLLLMIAPYIPLAIIEFLRSPARAWAEWKKPYVSDGWEG